jgi:glycogen(starch) synthase
MVLTVNYLHPRKRIDLIIQAAARCGTTWEEETRPRWVIVGDGPERDNLQALVDQLKLGAWVRFAGFVSDDELPRYYAAATCYIHAGLDESFGLSVIEAAYCGCPVVAVDEGGVQDTVDHGVTGYRVPPTASELARAVEAVLGREDRGRALGRAGYQRIASTYRWDQGAADLIRLAGTVKG